MQTINDITEEQINEFYNNHYGTRPAKSVKYQRGERVTPVDNPRKDKREYYFVTSIRWEPYGRGLSSNGGYMLLNPRTGNLISCTNIMSLDYPEKNKR